MKALTAFAFLSVLSISTFANSMTPPQPVDDQELSFDFGDVSIGESYYTTFDLTAPDDQRLEISDIMIDGEMYSAYTNCPEILEPGETCETEVIFEPTSEGEHLGELDFVTNLGGIRVYLTGTGVTASETPPENPEN